MFKNNGRYNNDVKAIVDDWICNVLNFTKNINRRRTGYGLKHVLQMDTGVYLLNEEFAKAMCENGFQTKPCKRGESMGENDCFFNVAYTLNR